MSVIDIEDGTSETRKPGGSSKQLGEIAEFTMIEIAAGFLAFVSIGTSIGALVLAMDILWVRYAAVLCFLLAPYSYFQQKRITDIRALKETLETIVHEVDRLRDENERLSSTVNDMSLTVNKLDTIEDALDLLTNKETDSVQKLLDMVEDNKDILRQMEKNLKAAVLQNIVSVIISSDKDMDSVLGVKETEGLIKRLKRLDGVIVNEKQLKKIILDHEGSIHGVMIIVKEVLDGTNDENVAISFSST